LPRNAHVVDAIGLVPVVLLTIVVSTIGLAIADRIAGTKQ
jgi:hypothetical protein